MDPTYGILWIPPKPIINIIQSWKDRLRSVEPDATYLNHPVHCTFFLTVADMRNEKDILLAFEYACNLIPVFSIEFLSWHIFKSDLVTGRDTITVAIKLSEALLQCQKKMAAALLPYKKKSVNYPIEWQGVYQQAYNQWGFPFVGNHWLPHISIASVTKKSTEIVNEITNSKNIPKSELLTGLSLYRIVDQNHKLLKNSSLRQ